MDSAAGWIYYTASPDNATQLYLYRTRLDGKGKQERVTPKDQPGYHLYQISSDGRWAFHSYSRFGTPPVVDLVRLPKHKSVRTLVANRRLRDAVARLRQGHGGVHEGGRGRRAPAGRLGHEAAGLRFDQALSGPLSRLRRARRPDRARPVGRRGLPLAPHAHAARLRGGEGRQPRHAVAAGTRVPEGDLQEDRPRQLGRSGGRRARRCAGGAGWTPPGSASGAGAAAARRRST